MNAYNSYVYRELIMSLLDRANKKKLTPITHAVFHNSIVTVDKQAAGCSSQICQILRSFNVKLLKTELQLFARSFSEDRTASQELTGLTRSF